MLDLKATGKGLDGAYENFWQVQWNSAIKTT